MKNRSWLWGLAALPLVGLPLIAQETAPPAPPAPQPAPAPAPDAKPAEATPAAASAVDAAADVDEEAEAASSETKRPADERMSADNNISFPVDI